jgi:hypothetical protein
MPRFVPSFVAILLTLFPQAPAQETPRIEISAGVALYLKRRQRRFAVHNL